MERDLRAKLGSSCDQLLQAAIKAGRQYFESVEAPLRDVEIYVMEPLRPGNWSSKRFTHQEIDIPRLHTFESTTLRNTYEWENAKDAVQAYVDENNIQPIIMASSNIEGYYLIPLFRDYVRLAGRFVYRKRIAIKIIENLLSHLDSPAPEVRGFIILEDFSAHRPFKLGSNMEIRPIAHGELIELGRTDTFTSPGLGGGAVPPRTDWWVCEAAFPNPRGTNTGFRWVNDVGDQVAIALRAFKAGGLSFGFATSQVVGPFGHLGTSRGGRLEKISIGTVGYSLSNAETSSFRRFWNKFLTVMEAENHYLQVPIRRLRAAGTRAQKEDALVDYVVGLEALLGTTDERTELGYRFRGRG